MLLPTSLLTGQAWQKWSDLEEEYERFYASWSKENHLAVRPVYEAFYEWCGIADSQYVSVLDIGGANGIHRIIHWKYPEKIDDFNVDPRIHFLHPYHLELYPSERAIDFPYIVGVGEYLPFKPNTFDICVTTAAVDHYCSPVDAFHEVFRCLKPKKKLYIMVSKWGSCQRLRLRRVPDSGFHSIVVSTASSPRAREWQDRSFLCPVCSRTGEKTRMSIGSGLSRS